MTPAQEGPPAESVRRGGQCAPHGGAGDARMSDDSEQSLQFPALPSVALTKVFSADRAAPQTTRFRGNVFRREVAKSSQQRVKTRVPLGGRLSRAELRDVRFAGPPIEALATGHVGKFSTTQPDRGAG
jgi:hypothetical protein